MSAGELKYRHIRDRPSQRCQSILDVDTCWRLVFTNYDVFFNFAAGDVDVEPQQATF